MIALALDKCRELSLERVLMCCDSDNFASARTIEKNGGVLENVVDGGGAPIKRYWKRGRAFLHVHVFIFYFTAAYSKSPEYAFP